MNHTRESQANNPNDFLITDLPIDVVRTIAEFTQTVKPHKTMGLLSLVNQSLHALFKPELPKLEMKEALMLAADASNDAIKKLLKMLDKNPTLLLKTGSVTTRRGLIVEKVTVYEFLLGAGDPDLAAQVAVYFAKLENGETARTQQYEKYKPHIDGMLAQKPYDLTHLINIIKEAKPEDVQAALNKQMTGSAIEKALEEFRQAVTKKKITQPQMHYDYQTLLDAFDFYSSEWKNLHRLSGYNYAKLDLFWRQVIGYLQRSLPAVERFAFLMGFYDLIENKIPLNRTTDFSYYEVWFPEPGYINFFTERRAPFNLSHSGLGFDYGIYEEPDPAWRRGGGGGHYLVSCLLETYIEQKISNLQNLCSVSENRNQLGV